MSKASIALALVVGMGIGKYACGSAASEDRGHDLQSTKRAAARTRDVIKKAHRAVDETTVPGWDDDEGWTVAEPEKEPRRGTIRLEPGMLVDPSTRTVYRIPPSERGAVDVPRPND